MEEAAYLKPVYRPLLLTCVGALPSRMESITRSIYTTTLAFIYLLHIDEHGANAIDVLRLIGLNSSPKEECYGELGCFGIGSGSGFEHHQELPEPPEEMGAEFYFYRPGDDNQSYQTIDYFNLSSTIVQLNYDTNKQLFVITHGFGKKWPKGWSYPMVNALLEKDANVILIRWTLGSEGPNYFQAAANTRIIGAMLAKVISEMVAVQKADLGRTTLVGFSLGAHVSGFAGKRLSGKLQRIIGLDPAGPLFTEANETARLDKGDAIFVEVLHTNALDPNGEGIQKSIGHVDLWANGGAFQPGCPSTKDSILDLSHLSENSQCSHARAPSLFIESVQNSGSPSACQFWAFSCSEKDTETYGRKSLKDFLRRRSRKKETCFSCNATSGCPVMGLSMDVGSPFNGDYHFYTRGGPKKGYTYCGLQHIIELTPGTEVKGKISLNFIFDDNSTQSMQFTEKDKKLIAGVVARATFTSQWGRILSAVEISYEKYESLFHTDGAASWWLKSMRIQYFDGTSMKQIKVAEEGFEVRSDREPKKVALVANDSSSVADPASLKLSTALTIQSSASSGSQHVSTLFNCRKELVFIIIFLYVLF